MFILNYLKENIYLVIQLFTLLNNFGNINAALNSYLFEKATGDDVKFSQIMYVTSVMSLIECCLTCKNEAECGLLNYNSLHVVNNCEIIRSGLNNTVVASQKGWNRYEASSSCPEEWTIVGSSCYRLENEILSWSDAQAKCAEHTNGHLVHISSGEENELMKTIYESQNQNGFGDIWIGLNDLDVMGTHKWTDGTVLSSSDYANWGAGQDGAGGEQCIGLYRSEGFNWHDFTCSGNQISMCEIDII